MINGDNVELFSGIRAYTGGRHTYAFGSEDEAANVTNQERMVKLAGSPDRVIPGHDLLQFERYDAVGRVAVIQ